MNDATDPDGRLEALLSELADLPPGDRPAFLDRVGDAGLRARLGRLAASLEAADAAGFGDPEPGPAAVGPGSVVGRYELVRLLGCGSSGEVYLARHATMRNRRYAVKVLSPRLTRDRAALARFRREMAAVAALDHPNVVAGIDAELSAWPPYLATEYLDGVTVSALLRADGRLPVGVACEIARQVCRGLHALGEKGFVHRDLSPANLFVTRAGVVKILDFGLVRLGEPGPHPEEWLTGSGLKLGNPAYLAPEQFREPSGVDPRADLYSLGCVLYQMLAGFAPFCDAGCVPRHELPDWHASRTPTSLRTLGDPVPGELAEVVERLLAKSPDDRPATAQEVERCLAPFASPAALEARAGRFPEPDALPTKLPALAAPPSGRGQRRVAGLLAGILLVAAAGAALVLDRPETRPGESAVAAPTPESPTRVTNSVGMAFVPVPAGEFLMGSPADERGREADLEAQRLVAVAGPYFLGATEVTQGQYFAVTKTNPSHFAPLGAGRDAVSGLDWRTLPADSVSWQLAVAFCERLSELPDEARAGRRYRLPTEVEWEYACRAGTQTAFHTGPTLSTRDANVHPDPAYDGATNGPYLDRTTPVASYRPNVWGLHDMHGNVMEWVATAVPGFPNRRVIRGMGFHHSAADCRSAYRGNPAAQGGDLTSGAGGRAYGFRVLMGYAAADAR